MLINHSTGEIAYHHIILKDNGDYYIKQDKLKNNRGKIEYIEPNLPSYKS